MPGQTRQRRRSTGARRGSRPRRTAPATGPTRKQIMRRRIVAGGIVVVAVLLVWFLFFSSAVQVKTVEVTGTKRLDEQTVLKAADVSTGSSMLGLDTSDVERRIARLPQVGRVVVERSWPSTVEVQVHERQPVAYFAAHDGIRLVDNEGVPFVKVPAKPKLPELAVRVASAKDPDTHAALAVLGSTDKALRAKIVAIKAPTPGSVELRLRKGKSVRWGDASDGKHKMQVLKALMTRPGKTYDVSSPELPTVR